MWKTLHEAFQVVQGEACLSLRKCLQGSIFKDLTAQWGEDRHADKGILKKGTW